MSKSPSRSEIETALSSQSSKRSSPHRKKAKPKASNNRSSEFEFGEPPRRQQVIGGDLTGVNQRKKFGIFSRYSDINIANWAAGFVVLLIIAAFFWPQSQNSISEVTQQLDEDKVVADEDQAIEQAASGNSSFARESDLSRAESYREQDALDQKITALLITAEQHIRERQFTLPEDANAVKVFRQVLALNPNNADAREGLGKIRQHFLVRGLRNLDSGKPAIAKSFLQRLSLIDATSTEYQQLDSAINEAAVDRQINELLAKARKAFAQKNLILPARASALAYYQQVLVLREDNATAKAGIKKVADTFIDQANKSVLSGDFGAAAAQLATVSVIDPEHKSIAIIEAMIARAKPLAEAAKAKQTASAQQSQATSEPNTRNEPVIADTNSSGSEANTASQNAAETNSSTAVGSTKTPVKQANEQAVFDRQYLQQGLNAYYSGDYLKAAALLQPLADKGIARAQMRLAYMHFLGRGFPRSREKADQIVRSTLPVIRKFANEGRGWAQSDLGSLYEDGLVLPRDFGEAVYWYRTAAEKGYPGAQTNLGIMYARGTGVASSRRTAIEWFQRAAKQGDSVAKRNLEAMGVKP